MISIKKLPVKTLRLSLTTQFDSHFILNAARNRDKNLGAPRDLILSLIIVTPFYSR